MADLIWWSGFVALIALFIALDLGVFHRRAHHVTMKKALFWTLFWIAVSLGFNLVIYFTRGPEAGLEFFTGYALEKMISLDNLFIFILVFSLFNVPREYQHRVLYLGMAGTLLLRMGFIIGGAALLSKFSWAIYLFGLFLIGMAIYLFRQERIGLDLKKSPFLRFLRRHLPLTDRYHGNRFFVNVKGQWLFTPLLLAVIVIEFFDIFYAVQSIPIIFAVTQDPFIIYTSNIFALLGLKSLYFVMAHFMYRFHFLRYGLAFTLGFVGVKILIEPWYALSDWVVLTVIVLAFVTCMILSVSTKKR